jgi:hypothetical protein
VARSDGGRAAPLGWWVSLQPAPDLAFQGTVRTTPAVACGPGSPPYPRRGALDL